MVEQSRNQDDEALRRAQFHRAVTTAEPNPDDLHKTLVMNMTTEPDVDRAMLTFTWMRRSPDKWMGWHPERCMDVAEQMGMT